MAHDLVVVPADLGAAGPLGESDVRAVGLEPVVTERGGVDAVVPRRLVELDERVRVEPVPTGSMTALDDHHVGVAVFEQGVDERHPHRAGTDDEMVGLDRRITDHSCTVARPSGIAGDPPRTTVRRVGSVPRVVVVGGGFGGLQCAKALQGAPVEVMLIDRRDFHLFTPLLYQVASCLLNPSEIAAPLRKVFRNVANVRYREGDVARCDLEAKAVVLTDGTVIEYDHLVLATGSVPNFYGNDEVERRALGLKDLGSALQLRNHVLECLERATTTTEPARLDRLLTFCIVGAGPTGVEYAGALAEFARLVFPQEYPELAEWRIRILLLEGGDRVLPTFKRRLSSYAQRELTRRGVEIRLGVLVESADDTGIVLQDGAELATATLVWTAGVRPADVLDQPPRRIEVDDHLRVVGARDVYAIGDVAAGPRQA